MTMKVIYGPGDSRMTDDLLSFETKTRDENPKSIYEISMDDQKKDSDNKGEKQISPIHGISVTVEEFTLCNKNVHRDSISDRDEGSDLFGTVSNAFTDKNVLEYDHPESDVMKDICVDDGMPENNKDLIEHSEDNKTANLVNQCEMKEDNGGESLDQEIVKASSVSSSKNDNSVKYSLEENSTQSVLESFLDSLDSDENKLTQPSEQIPIEQAFYKDPAPSSSEFIRGLDESGKSIKFNFADAGQVQCTSSDEQSLVFEDKDPDNSDILCANSNSSDSCNAQSPSDNSQCSTNEDVPAVEQNYSKWQSDQGEMSFSAVTYSGPGSISHRSDASTASTRSFAFPILQCEWNSSPVRMAEADRRQLRKQKSWRSGLLCCRF